MWPLHTKSNYNHWFRAITNQPTTTLVVCTWYHLGVTYCLPDAELPELQQAELQSLLQRLVLQLQGSGVGGQVLHRGRGAVWTCSEHIEDQIRLSSSGSVIIHRNRYTIHYFSCISYFFNRLVTMRFLMDEPGILSSHLVFNTWIAALWGSWLCLHMEFLVLVSALQLLLYSILYSLLLYCSFCTRANISSC